MSVSPFKIGGLRIDAEPDVIEVTDVVVTVKPVFTVSITLLELSIVLTVNDADVPWYLTF